MEFCGVKWGKVGNSKEYFFGEYRFTLDDKNRFFIPAKFREKLSLFGRILVLTRGLEKCLLLYPREEWINLTEKIGKLPFTSSEARKFSRYLFSGAYECEIDSQGRISLPAPLKKYAEIKKDIVIIGVGERIEIWGKEEWDKYTKEVEKEIEEIAGRLKEYGV
ncbi:division/cell wall cluster transcriptional repressor MraZ [Candidatus Calescamantes bacterium]|nr:division/cell wall cluster transcriptional repressor MraZ [Candidatus Calescamantes bacterium]